MSDTVFFTKMSKSHMLWIVFIYTITLRAIISLCKLYVYYVINYVYGKSVAEIGKKTNIRPTVILREAHNIKIGSNCEFNNNTILHGGKYHAKLIIGNNVLVGPNVAFYVANHNIINAGIPIKEQGYREADIIVEDDVWIGANSVITSGVHIGKGAVIGAGSVVTRDIPAFVIAAGTPAHVIKSRPV